MHRLNHNFKMHLLLRTNTNLLNCQPSSLNIDIDRIEISSRKQVAKALPAKLNNLLDLSLSLSLFQLLIAGCARAHANCVFLEQWRLGGINQITDFFFWGGEGMSSHQLHLAAHYNLNPVNLAMESSSCRHMGTSKMCVHLSSTCKRRPVLLKSAQKVTVTSTSHKFRRAISLKTTEKMRVDASRSRAKGSRTRREESVQRRSKLIPACSPSSAAQRRKIPFQKIRF